MLSCLPALPTTACLGRVTVCAQECLSPRPASESGDQEVTLGMLGTVTLTVAQG